MSQWKLLSGEWIVFTFKRITPVQRGILGRDGREHLAEKVRVLTGLAAVAVFNLAALCQWRLTPLLPAQLIHDSNISCQVLVADAVKPLPLLLNTPTCRSGCTCGGALLNFAVIRLGIVQTQRQADKDGLVLAPSNIDEPDGASLNKDGHITSDLGHSGPASGGMRRKTQLEDEQRGQMRSYLTHI